MRPDSAAVAAGCPFHAALAQQAGEPELAAVPPPLAPSDELVLPLNRRIVVQYATNEAGQRELRLFYADKEISFDEPGLFAFGETLARQTRFIAGSAVEWGPGYEWATLKGLFEALLEQGVLQRGEAMPPEPAFRPDGERPSPLPPAETETARTWDECEQVMRELTGRPLELGYLELVVPVFRVAHMALDADGRQVGEANVFPPRLRLDVPTRWRTCIYPGTRFQQDRPMNVSALKVMRAHWPQIMGILRRVRHAYLERFPAARNGWTVGHIERLATVVLALPTYQLMRAAPRVENGQLHGALSCLFRVTDGLRMVMHQMLFVPIGEPALKPDAPMTAAEIHAYAERNYSFHSGHGVCAGPQAMIAEFLATLVDGVATTEAVVFDPAVQAALDDLEPAMDYGLRGLQAYASVFSMWPVMTRAYERLLDVAQAAAPRSAFAAQLAQRLADRVERIRAAAYLSNEAWRADREQVYADMYAQCTFGLTGEWPARPLSQRIAAAASPEHGPARQAVRTALERAFGEDARHGSGDIALMLHTVMAYLAQAQGVLRVACESQAGINTLLGRTPPRRSFEARDVDLHNRLQGPHDKHLPFLVDELEEVLGLRVTLQADRLEVAEAPGAAA